MKEKVDGNAGTIKRNKDNIVKEINEKQRRKTKVIEIVEQNVMRFVFYNECNVFDNRRTMRAYCEENAEGRGCSSHTTNCQSSK